jgi:hypothetical protein
MSKKLSEHFTLEELTVSDTARQKGLNNTPKGEALENLIRLAEFLEDVRALFGRPITINSAYRGPEVNAAVGGAKKSDHMDGRAADIRVKDIPVDEVVHAIIGSDLPYDKVIKEFAGSKTGGWTHLSIAEKGAVPRKMKLTIDSKGQRPYEG